MDLAHCISFVTRTAITFYRPKSALSLNFGSLLWKENCVFHNEVYWAAISKKHIEADLPSPKVSAIASRALRRYRKLLTSNVDTRLPVFLSIMRTIKCSLFLPEIFVNKKALCWASLSLAFFAFLRSSEITMSKLTLRCAELTVAGGTTRINLRCGKTDQLRRGRVVAIPARGRSFWAVRIMKLSRLTRTAWPTKRCAVYLS